MGREEASQILDRRTEILTFIEELLSAWSQADRKDISSDLGYPRVSPAFRQAVGDTHDEEPFDLSSADIKRISEVVQALARTNPDEFAAVGRRFRPWVHGSPRAGDDYLLQVAYTRLSKFFLDGHQTSQ